MKLLLENWRKYLNEEKVNVPFYRADTVFDIERLKQLCGAVGKEYIIYRRKGSPAHIGTYMSPNKDVLMPYAKGEAGQKAGRFGALTKLEILEINGIDEAMFDSNTLPWLDVRKEENQKRLKQIFGDGIVKYFNEIAKAQAEFFDAEIAADMFARFEAKEEIHIKPGANAYMEQARKSLGSDTGGVVEQARRDPEIINYFLTQKSRPDWVEFNFRMNPDGSGTKVQEVIIFDLENNSKEISCEEAMKTLEGEQNETPT